METANTPRPDSVAENPEAKLSEPAWVEPDTLFQQEAEVSVKLSLPEGKEHVTRVQAELFAKTPKGRESIAKGEGHADSTGEATFVLPVYKPQGHKEGVVEYFIEFTHKLAKALSTESLLRKVSETALRSADHVLVPGITFTKDSSFIPPKAAEGFRKVESKLKEWDAKDSKKAKIVVFGHAEQDEKDAKALSERRAQSAYAFISNNADTWEKLYGTEKWGLAVLQTLLKDLGHYHGTPNGVDGPQTHEALKAIQGKTSLPETGKEDASTRKAIFAAYMKGKHDINIDSSRFRQVTGNPWMGCGSNNRVKEGEKSVPENRRVAFLLIIESKFFPVHFPCQDGSELPCQAQCKKAGKRSASGIKCAFYDELVREESQPPATEEPKEEAKSEAFDRIGFEGYEGKGYVIKDFKKYEGCAIQLNPDIVSPKGADVPDGFNNQCVSFVRFFGLPQTSTWKKGPRVCDIKPGQLPEGTVVATLRDGVYYSDTYGRSHVGIYLEHDDYSEYSKNPSDTAGVKFMDQWKGAIIDSRKKKYSEDGDKETNKKAEWTDIHGVKHEHRTNWINDGEEYYVVLAP